MKLSKLTWISGSILLGFLLIALFTPFLAGPGKAENFFPIIKFGPETSDIFSSDILTAPNSEHWFGTDYIGRDVLSRLIYAIRNSIWFSIATVAICLALGVVVGGIMGFFGGWIDIVLSRMVEVVSNFPVFLLQLTLLAFLPQSYAILLFVMILTGWIPYARFARAEFFRLRSQEFVQAAQGLGASRIRIFFKHILPNSLTPVLIYVPFDLSSTIVVLGALSFLGFGEPINVPSIGELLKQSKEHFREAWWLAVFPGGTLFLLTLSLTLFGSGIRDKLDPRQSQE